MYELSDLTLGGGTHFVKSSKNKPVPQIESMIGQDFIYGQIAQSVTDCADSVDQETPKGWWLMGRVQLSFQGFQLCNVYFVHAREMALFM